VQTPTMSTEAERTGYANCAGALAKECAGMGLLWELWNEANTGFWNSYPWMPDSMQGKYPPDPDNYTAMAKAAAIAIKAADTSCRVLACASSAIDMAFIERCCYDGILDYVDAISVHPYDTYPPEALVDKVKTMRAMMRKYSPVADKIAIVNSEWGMASDTPNVWRSAMPPRMWLVSSYCGLPVSSWYEWQAWEFGLLTNSDGGLTGDPTHPTAPSGTPTMVYYAAKNMLNTLNGYSVTQRINTGNPNEWVLEFRKGLKVAYALWTLDGSPGTIDSSHTATIPIPGPNSGELVTMFGDSASQWQKTVDVEYGSSTDVTIPSSGGFIVSLSECPKYLVLNDDVAVRGFGKTEYLQKEIRYAVTAHGVAFSGLNKGAKIRLFDMRGHLIKDLSAEGNETLWNRRNQAAGIYVARTKDAALQRTFKVVLSH
jgi:hypothetical protein